MRGLAYGVMMTAALLLGAGPAAAAQRTAPAAPLQISYPTDASMTCDQITTEIARMDTVMGVSAQGISNAEGSAQMAELGASAGINAALYSGALARVPGLGMFANGAAQMAKQRAAAKAQQEQANIQTATTRRAMLAGVYQGRNCAAAPPPVAVTIPAVAPAVPAVPAVTPATTIPASTSR